MASATNYLRKFHFSNDSKKFSILTTLVVLSMISIPISASAAPCNCVIFRLDDIQDYYLNNVQRAIMDKFIDKSANVTVGVIANFTGNDQSVVTKVQTGHNTNVFELAIHGYDHVDFANTTKYPLQTQKDHIKLAGDKLKTLFGRNSTIFLMPFNGYSTTTQAAMQQTNLKILSAEFDQELDQTKIYKAIPPSDIKDVNGIYHLPQVIEFHSSATNSKTPLNTIMNTVNSTITTHGYAVITLHPSDFAQKSGGVPIAPSQVNATEIADLDTLITTIRNQGKTIKTFSAVTNVPYPATSDNNPPTLTIPSDIKQIVPLNEYPKAISLGTATATDDITPTPQIVITNNSTGLFNQGTTAVKWTAQDLAGNNSSKIQYVTLNDIADGTTPTVNITQPTTNQIIQGTSLGYNLRINGTASDPASAFVSGVKNVTLSTNIKSGLAAVPESPGNWTKWTYTLRVLPGDSGPTTAIDPRAFDFWNNQGFMTPDIVTGLTINLSGPDTTAPEIIPPPNINKVATGPLTSINLGTPKVYDNSDPNPIISNNVGVGENPGFPPGETIVTWTATDASNNSASVTQSVIFTYTPPEITSVVPNNGAKINDSFSISYTLSEAVSGGSITFTRTGGAEDNNTHSYLFGSGDRTIGAHTIQKADLGPGFANLVDGAIYTMTISVDDSVTLVSTVLQKTLITYDVSLPTFTIQYFTDPGLTTSLGNNPKLKAGTYHLKITASEALTGAPTVTINAQGTANDVTNVATSIVSGNDYRYTRTIVFDAAATGTLIEDISVTGTDLAANLSSNVNPTNEATKAAFTDTVAPVITLVSPGTSSAINQFNVVYSLSESVNTGTITFTHTGGTSDPASPHVYTIVAAGDKTVGPHSISKTTLQASAFGTLINNANYSMTLSVTDSAGNVSVLVTKTGLIYSTTLNECIVPGTGDLSITTGCKITTTKIAPGNVTIQNGAIVTIENGGTLDVNFTTKSLNVKYGSGVLVKSGGKIS